MNPAIETPVKLLLFDGAWEDFAIIEPFAGFFESPEDFDESLAAYWKEHDKLRFSEFDPLTSKVLEGVGLVHVSQVHSIEKIPSLPVADDYVVDAVLRPNWYTEVDDKDDRAEFLKAYWRQFTDWLAGQNPPLIHEGVDLGSRIRRSDLTDLGLDFMRQHSRQIKENATDKQELPSRAELDKLAEHVKQHRTTDADWELDY